MATRETTSTSPFVLRILMKVIFSHTSSPRRSMPMPVTSMLVVVLTMEECCATRSVSDGSLSTLAIFPHGDLSPVHSTASWQLCGSYAPNISLARLLCSDPRVKWRHAAMLACPDVRRPLRG